MPTNFLLASSAIIPILALTVLVELRVYRPTSLPLSRTYRFVLFVGFLSAVFNTVNGEWVCLRSLEVGHLVHGALGHGTTTAVWGSMIALALVVFAVLGFAILIGPSPDS